MKRLNDGLTEKEMMFCEEYIIDMNATHAAIRAGYSEDSAKSIGYHLRQRPQVDASFSSCWINEVCACALQPRRF